MDTRKGMDLYGQIMMMKEMRKKVTGESWYKKGSFKKEKSSGH